MGQMRILDSSGDTTVTWSPQDAASVARAEATFARLSRERKIPFARAAGASADTAERIRAFDPQAEEIVWIRPVAGG